MSRRVKRFNRGQALNADQLDAAPELTIVTSDRPLGELIKWAGRWSGFEVAPVEGGRALLAAVGPVRVHREGYLGGPVCCAWCGGRMGPGLEEARNEGRPYADVGLVCWDCIENGEV